MYLWKTSRLVEELKIDAVSEKDKMLYVLTTSLVYALICDPLFATEVEYSSLDWANLFLTIAITALGTLYTFKKNRDGDNRDFITRYTALSVPIGFRLILLSLAGGIAIGFIEGAFSDAVEGSPSNETTLLQLSFFTGAGAVYYWLLGRGIESVAKRSDA